MDLDYEDFHERFSFDGEGSPTDPEPGELQFPPAAEVLQRLSRLLLAARLELVPRSLVARRMTRAGIHAAIVAVYRSTGLLFRQETLHTATTQELVDWHEAGLAWERETGGSIERCWIAEEEYWRLAEREPECGEDADALAWCGAESEPEERRGTRRRDHRL